MPGTVSSPVYVLGVGMTKFVKPRGKIDYMELGYEAGIKALLDAHINYDDVDMGVACYCYGDSTCGQRVFYQFGMTGIPIYNVNNNCATASTGLVMARNAVGYGQVDCVLVVGFEKMNPGSLDAFWKDRADPIGRSVALSERFRPLTKAPIPAQLFANAAQEYIERHGASPEDFAEIARINHSHSQRNPYAQFRDVYTLDEILNAPTIEHPLTKLQCCPTSDGGAAAVIVSQAFLDARPELKPQAIRIAGQKMASDPTSSFDGTAANLVGAGVTRSIVKSALEEAGLRSIFEVQVCELHDCFSAAQMIFLDALGIAEPGKAHEFVREGRNTYPSPPEPKKSVDEQGKKKEKDEKGGNRHRVLVNPSGGLLSKGHPLGATGLAQCAELTWHLRGWANNRLVPRTRVALAHNLGLGGAGVVTVYTRADGRACDETLTDEAVARWCGLGYNPATTARGFTREEARRVRSRRCKSEWALGGVEKSVLARF